MQSRNVKYLSCALIVAFAIIVYATANIRTAEASKTATQVVTVTIRPIRALYVDEEEKIVAIFNNIQAIADEELQVFKSGTEIPLSDEIILQYKRLMPGIDWSTIGWVYQQPKPDSKDSTKIQMKEASEEIYSYSEKDFYKGATIGANVSEKEIFDIVTKLNSSPPLPHKENYIRRVTVVDAEEGLTKISVDYLL